MSTSKIAKPRKTQKLAADQPRQKASQRRARERSDAAAAAEPLKSPSRHAGRATKQETVLTLLSQPDGVSIPEVMVATDWQQHSVRGFLAGTVKKKLGFQLTSSKAEGADRRYRIEAVRGR